MAAPAFDAQRAVKMEAGELQEYMRELFSWSKEMKNKGTGGQAAEERQPKRPAAAAAPAAASPAPPPVKASGAPDREQPQQEAADAAAAVRHPAAHTYEHYRAKWDRFDVDAALAESDDEASDGGGGTRRPGSSGSKPGPSVLSASAPIDIPQARLTVPVNATGPSALVAPGAAAPTSADGWKDAGNGHFKAGRHQAAVECYGRSLELAPSCLAHANRAMAQLKLGRHAEAEADCSAALALDPGYVKARLRRAAARRLLGNLLGAVEDCEEALRLEPCNRQAAVDRAEALAALLQREGLPAPSRAEVLEVVVAGGSAGTAGAAQPAKPSQLVAAAPLTPAATELGGADIRESSVQRRAADVSSGPAAAAAATVAPLRAAIIQEITSSGAGAGEDVDELPDLAPEEEQPADEPSQLAGHQSPAQQQQQAVTQQLPAQQQQQQQQPAQQQQRVAMASAALAPPPQPAQQAATLLPSASAETEQPAQELAPRNQQQPVAAAAPAAAAAAATVPAAAASRVAPARVPRTGVEFEKGWKVLRGDRTAQAAYLLALPPAALPALLRQALTPTLLAAACASLLNPGLSTARGAAAALLGTLPDVPRFDLNLLSVPARQRAELAAEWDAAAAAAAEGDAGVSDALGDARRRWKL